VPRLADCLVAAQVALSVVLVVAAGLLVRTFVSLTTRPLGFKPDQVLVVTMDAQRTGVDPAERVVLATRALDAVRALPNVADAAFSYVTPLSNGFTPPIEVAGVPASDTFMEVFGNLVSPGWFSTYQTPIVAGRVFTDHDRQGAPRVAVVNEAFVRRFLGDTPPLGHTMTLFPHSAMALPPIEIVGVVADAVYDSVRKPAPPTWYIPWAQFGMKDFPFTAVDFSVRSTAGPAGTLARSITATLADVNPQLTLTFRPLADRVTASLTQERLIALVAGFFGALALLLAGLGLYGVTSYAVARRRMEIGIRVALGATPSRIIQWVLQRVGVVIGGGLIAGLLLSLWMTRYVAALLYGVSARDRSTLLGALGLLAGVGLLAGWLPARRAARVDPATALRTE
jgi:putative ABC transport system permease protein